MRGNTGIIEEDCPLYEFDELLDDTQSDVIADYLESSTMYEVAIDDLRYMKFNANGKIMKGYDE